MKKILAFVLFSILISNEIDAQLTRYIVRFKDKNSSPYSFSNPLSYLSQRAIDRRTKYGIAIDSTDLPVNPSYINQIKNIANVTLLNISRWQNAVTIKTTDPSALTTINNLSFVRNVNTIAARNVDPGIQANKFEKEDLDAIVPPSANRIAADYYNYGAASYNEIHLHNGEFLHNIGLRGQGMQIAMLDNGFNNYLTLKAFDSVNAENRVLGTWDFVANEANVADDGSHGMSCLSTICANIPGQFIGKAPKASFWLYQTEDNTSEYPIEEFNWVCGAERADSSGADVISSSLGYYDFDDPSFNYTYAQMNGHSTIAVIGASNATKKGMLVFLANGNEGTNAWHYLITPADADSILAVGAVNVLGAVGGFSSYGPSADGRVKPEVASVGVGSVIQSTGNTVVSGNGTSFACPNMAGLGTILWQAFPEFNNMKIRTALLRASSKFTTPDDRIGYGIPNMKTAFANLLIDYATSSATVNSCNATISWTSKDVSNMLYEIERKLPADANYSKIADVPASSGAQLTTHSYSFNNAILSPIAGVVSYRIRQVIDTNAASFTAVYVDTANVSIASGCFATGTGGGTQLQEKISVQPNPVSGNTATLIIETPYAVNNMPILIYDSKGSLILKMQSSKIAGKKTIDIDVSRFSKGQYYIKVMNNTQPIGTVELMTL
ncbi:MAG: S8 family peptidase [Bacteroidetes bacterium]|nr:S8 family peptidase [Bacteroidota bacterium]